MDSSYHLLLPRASLQEEASLPRYLSRVEDPSCLVREKVKKNGGKFDNKLRRKRRKETTRRRRRGGGNIGDGAGSPLLKKLKQSTTYTYSYSLEKLRSNPHKILHVKKKENDDKQIRSSSFSVVDNFQSPILISNLAVATDVDRELVRSIAFFGESESFWDTLRRNPNFLYRLDSASKKVARDRRRYLLSVRANQPEKFEAFCKHYNIPFEVGSKNLSLEFNETIENTCKSTNDNKKNSTLTKVQWNWP